jgi:hypothetical protein
MLVALFGFTYAETFQQLRFFPCSSAHDAAIVPARCRRHLLFRTPELGENSAPDLPPEIAGASEKLVRGMGLVQSSAVNMPEMIGIGPFITIGVILSAMGGPQAVLGWFLGAVFSVCDGMVYAELGAAMPGAGGAYIYFREAFNPRSWGILFSFLFLWETIFVAPLAISAACVGFAEYTHYFFPSLSHAGVGALAAAACVLITFLLYRPIKIVGRMSVVMLALAVVYCELIRQESNWVIYEGVTRVGLSYPRGVLRCQRSSPRVLTNACCVRVCWEST